jgi:site-specific DNA recombinase
MRLVGYARVSTEDQAREGISLDDQRARIAAYCAYADHAAELVGIEQDAGISAKTIEDRPGLVRALAMLARGEADGLIVVKLDRLTRSVRNLGELIEGPFKRAQLISLGEKIDTQSAGGRLVLNLLSSVSAWEREVASERTSAAMQHLRRVGRLVGAVPYGCRVELDPAGRKVLVRDEPEQRVLAEARRLRAAGLSLRTVAAELERQGHLSRNGRRFDPAQVGVMTRAAA